MESRSSSSRPKTGVETSGCWLILEGRQERLKVVPGRWVSQTHGTPTCIWGQPEANKVTEHPSSLFFSHSRKFLKSKIWSL